MINLTPTNNNFNIQTVSPIKKQSNLLGNICVSKFQNKCNLKQDTIAFCGSQNIPLQLSDRFAKVLEDNSMKFCRRKIDNILPFVTSKNIDLISKILNTDKIEKPTLPQLIDTLKYMILEFKNGSNINKKVEILTQNASRFPEAFFSYDLSNKLLKSQILLSDEHHPLRAFNHAITRIQDMVDEKKANKDIEMKANGITEYNYKDIDNFTKSNMLALIIANLIYEQGTFNNLAFNRINVFQRYAKDLLSLDFTDLKALRLINTEAEKEIHNDDGSYSTDMLSVDEKLTFLNLYAINKRLEKNGYSCINFKEMIPEAFSAAPRGNFQVNMQEIKEAMMPHILKYNGVSDEGVGCYLQSYEDYKAHKTLDKSHLWDMDWMHLMCFNNQLLKSIIKHGTEGTFFDFIYKDHNEIANSNRTTKEEFAKFGIDYDKWLNPNMDIAKKEFTSKTGKHKYNFTINLWDRAPQKSLFNGNYTTCCTGIGNIQGESYLKYLTNTAFNTFEIKIDNNKTIGMSRVFVAKINQKPSLIVENIEVNNNIARHFLYNDKSKQEFREFIFDYIRKYAKTINKSLNDDIPIYFGGNYLKIKDITKGLNPPQTYTTDNKYTKLIGQFPEEIYINCIGGVCHPKDKNLKLCLIDITKPVHASSDVQNIDNAPYIQEYEAENLAPNFETK